MPGGAGTGWHVDLLSRSAWVCSRGCRALSASARPWWGVRASSPLTPASRPTQSSSRRRGGDKRPVAGGRAPLCRESQAYLTACWPPLYTADRTDSLCSGPRQSRVSIPGGSGEPAWATEGPASGLRPLFCSSYSNPTSLLCAGRSHHTRAIFTEPQSLLK